MRLKQENLPYLFIIFYLALLIFLAFYIEDFNNGIKIDPVRLYNNDAAQRYYSVHCAPYAPIMMNGADPRPVYFFVAVPFTQLLENIGIQGMTAHRIFVSIFSALALFALQGIARKLNFNIFFTMGLLILVAFNPFYLIYSLAPHETVVFASFIVMGVYLFYRDRYLASIFLIGITSLIRNEGYIFCGLWGIYYLLRFKRESLKYIFVSAVPNLIYFIANYILYRDPLYVSNLHRSIFEVYINVFKSASVSSTPMENFTYFVPPIINEFGWVFFILAAVGFFYTLRDRKFLPVNVAIGANLLFVSFTFFFFLNKVFDKWVLPIVLLSSISLVALLIKIATYEKVEPKRSKAGTPGASRPSRDVLSRRKPLTKYIVLPLFLIMILTNAYNLYHGIEALGECCDIRSYLPLPVETMNWIKNYTTEGNAKTVYYNSFTLWFLDDECVLIKNKAKGFTPPSSDCTYLVPYIYDLKYSLNFPEDGVLLNQGELRCMPEGYNSTLIGEIKEDGMKIYNIERKTNNTKIYGVDFR